MIKKLLALTRDTHLCMPDGKIQFRYHFFQLSWEIFFKN